MVVGARAHWKGMLDHPILRLELRRIRRTRWWPGRRFFLFYPALLGGALGCGVVLVLSTLVERLSVPLSGTSMQLTALVTGAPAVCLLSVVTWLLSFALPWIAPVFTATTIARERELGTFDLLRVTLLSERSIVLGKLGGSLARLWPGVLTLLLLTPLQIVWVVGSSSLGPLSSVMTGAMIVSELETSSFWMWLVLAGVVGWLRPWGALSLNAAVGLFISALARSSGMAIAAAYGVIIALRAVIYLVRSLLNMVLMAFPAAMLGASEPAMDGGILSSMLILPSLATLAVVLIEFAGTALLVWATMCWLRRM